VVLLVVMDKSVWWWWWWVCLVWVGSEVYLPVGWVYLVPFGAVSWRGSAMMSSLCVKL
jgi:hypothetical protein